MNITVYCPYYLPHSGGLENHSDEFNKYIALAGANVLVFTPHIPSHTPTQTVVYDRVKIIRFPAFELISNFPVPKFWQPQFWQLAAQVWKQPTDIIISRTRFFTTSLMALVHAKAKHIPWVHVEHGSGFVTLSNPLTTFLARVYDHTFGWLVLRQSTINISISHAVQVFVARFDKRPSPIIYRGLEFASMDKIMPDTDTQKKYQGKIIITTAARLYKWKGIAVSIAAIKRLPANITSKIIFLVVGDGEDFARLKRLAAGLPIVMLGNLSRVKAISLLKVSDIYIHSSLPGGGLSTSLLEALYCQCAVIATPNEGAREIINAGQNGLLIAPTNPQQLSEKIIHLLNNPTLRKSLSHQANQTMRHTFNWQSSIRSYNDIFNQLCQPK